ncbi:conserved hypothetical protein [Candidatus Nitrotoga sp. HW29]|uniref:hypothetical protein n=1 Tax=Candidatus Nitrotoga sp. HW29 TaxID=2886963 RepID=UPI001EF1877E|nr:hypothetical protein [Candidatus Nitrotoga sp. HW29]CAH1904050.1 conserved hypothetical protein [Candidatus Nitrotoga sp. HW29]
MAIGWINALRVIPWKDVLEAAPGMVKGAKRLFTTAKDEVNNQPMADSSSTIVSFDAEGFANLENRVRHLQAQVAELNSNHNSSAKLIKSLAEQNAHVVNVIEILKVRTKILIYACALLTITLSVLIFLVVLK